MAMNKPAAYGLYSQDAALPDIICTLNDAGFGKEDICVMLSPSHPIATIVREASILNGEREATAITAGLIGWLSEFGAVLMPTIGFFIRSQAFFHALVVTRNSPALCGSSRAFAALGFPENEAERFEDQLRQVGALIYVSCPESAMTNCAIELLQRTGAREAAALEGELVAESAA
ncbi:MAG: hypothetical protein WB799_25025 [Candidatus Sulfotelmatobacter sp.]